MLVEVDLLMFLLSVVAVRAGKHLTTTVAVVVLVTLFNT